MPKKKIQPSPNEIRRNLDKTEAKAIVDSNSKINTNLKDVATQVSKSLDENSSRYNEILNEELQSLNRRIEGESDPEKVRILEKKREDILKEVKILYQETRKDQKDIYEQHQDSSHRTIWANLGIASLIVGVIEIGKPTLKWAGQNLPKLIFKK